MLSEISLVLKILNKGDKHKSFLTFQESVHFKILSCFFVKSKINFIFFFVFLLDSFFVNDLFIGLFFWPFTYPAFIYMDLYQYQS